MPSAIALPRIALALLLLAIGAGSSRAAVRPIGEEFTVKSGQVNNEHNPTVAFGSSGRGVVVWTDSHDGLRVRAIYPSGAFAVEDRVVVQNSELPEIPGRGIVTERKDPAILVDADGGFWLFWTEEVDELKIDFFDETRTILDRDIWGRHFDASGEPTGAGFRLNATKDGFQRRPRAVRVPCAVPDPDCGEGNLLVAWESDDRMPAVGPDDGIFGRLLSASGQMRSAQLRLAPASPANGVALATDGRGNVIASWVAPDPTGRPLVRARFFNAGGKALGPQFAVSDGTGGVQLHPAVARDGDSNRVLVLFDRTMPQLGRSRIIGRRFTSPGKPAGEPFSVSRGARDFLPIAAATRTAAVVLWLRWSPSPAIQGAGVEEGSQSPGDPFTLTVWPRFSMGVGARPDGKLLAVWEGYGLGSSQAVLGRWLASVP